MPSPSSPSAPSTVDWLDGLDSRFRRASEGAEETLERTYSIAGRPLRVRFASEAMLRRFGPALAHVVSDDAPDGTHVVHVWDAASTGTEPPPVQVPDGSPLGTVFTHAADSRRALYMVGIRALSVYDADANASWYWAADADRLPAWECASPLRHVLHWWLADHGLQQVHAGSVGTERGAVLVVGRGGRGKSTTTLAALGQGLKYVGDDYVAVELEPEPLVHSIYNAGKLEPHHLDRFPHLRDHAIIDDVDPLTDFEKQKAILFVHSHFPDQTAATLPLRALIVPTIDAGGSTTVEPASRAEALRALAPSTILQLHVGEQRLLSKMTKLAAQLPAYTLRLGDDVDRVGPLIASLVDDHRTDG